MSTTEIDVEALASVSHTAQDSLDTSREVPVWEAEDAPAGSTAESLLVFDRGRPVRVAGPTHYQHLADGRVIAGYNGGTHYTEPGENGHDKVTKILAIHEG